MAAPRPSASGSDAALRRKNVRLGLLLGAVALAFFAAVIVKHVFGI